MLGRNHICLKMNFKMVIILSAACLALSLIGCSASPSIVHYENESLGISLDYPANWEIDVDERVDNHLVLEVTQGFLVKNSALIEMWVNTYSCSSFEIFERINSRIDMLWNRYELDDHSVVHPPTKIDDWEYEALKISVSTPTISLPEDSYINQMHEQDEDTIQILDSYVIRNSDDCYVHVDVYSGKSDELNDQAHEIVKGIRFINQDFP